MAAVWARQRARLQADAVCQALPPVADPSAAMRLARQRFVTHQTTGDVLEVARDVAALLSSRTAFFNHKDRKGGHSGQEVSPRASPCTTSR